MPKERSGNDGGAYGSADGKAFVAERPCDHGDEHGNSSDAQQNDMLKYIFVHVHKSISLIGKLIDNSGKLRQRECFGAGVCFDTGLLEGVCYFLLRYMQRIGNGIDSRFAALCERGANDASSCTSTGGSFRIRS